MNLLKYETSPYLLQHAQNPVHWKPWGVEAFALAEKENKPVLVSIGYSSCHWCHVMEHESFEEEETAQLMNQLFINIKVDREEYPDVDHYYMDAVQAMTGSGGWPLNVFLTPNKRAFYGGTYFPKTRMHNRASWKETLINVSQYFQQNRNEVEAQANKLSAHLIQTSNLGSSAHVQEDFSTWNATEVCEAMKQKILSLADNIEGGFGSAPKFPSTFSIQYLLDDYAITHDEKALQQAILSLDKMMMGGIYDQVGGGFSRYSTDSLWHAPHFEKMLYDNALLLEVYSTAYQLTKNEAYRTVVQQTIEWLQREMTDVKGGFYSAQDADSEGVEGKYYTWAADELKMILETDYDAFATYFQIKLDGNWEHTNILWTNHELIQNGSTEFKDKLPKILDNLLQIRSLRIKPLTDDKLLLSWNALMSKALLKASLVLDNNEYFLMAEKNIQYLLNAFQSEDYLYFHTSKNEHAKIPAYLDDLAYFAETLILYAQVTANTDYLFEVQKIIEYVFLHFHQEGASLFDFANKKFMQVDVSKQEIYDGATPSANGVFCKVLNYMSFAMMNSSWKQNADTMLQTAITLAQKHPTSFAVWANIYQHYFVSLKEVSLIGKEAQKYFMQIYTKIYKSNVIYMNTKRIDETLVSLKGKGRVGQTLLYLCQENTCLPQFDNIEAFLLAIN